LPVPHSLHEIATAIRYGFNETARRVHELSWQEVVTAEHDIATALRIPEAMPESKRLWDEWKIIGGTVAGIGTITEGHFIASGACFTRVYDGFENLRECGHQYNTTLPTREHV
jgi:hypothetical protein